MKYLSSTEVLVARRSSSAGQSPATSAHAPRMSRNCAAVAIRSSWRLASAQRTIASSASGILRSGARFDGGCGGSWTCDIIVASAEAPRKGTVPVMSS